MHSDKLSSIALRPGISRNPFAVWRTTNRTGSSAASRVLRTSLSVSVLSSAVVVAPGGGRAVGGVQADFLFLLIRRRTHKRTPTKGRRRMRIVKKDKQYRKMK
jgi:hypothetical protein